MLGLSLVLICFMVVIGGAGGSVESIGTAFIST